MGGMEVERRKKGEREGRKDGRKTDHLKSQHSSLGVMYSSPVCFSLTWNLVRSLVYLSGGP